MIYGTKTLYQVNNNASSSNIFSNNNIDSSYIEEDYDNTSLFIESLNLLQEENNHFLSVFNESASNISIFDLLMGKASIVDIISNIIDNFIEMIENLFNRFLAFMMKFFNKDVWVMKYKNKFSSITFDINSTFDRYIFTNLDASTNAISVKNELNKEYASLIADLDKFKSFSSASELMNIMMDYKNTISNTEDYYNEMRANIVESSSPISREEFASKLFNYFRSDGKFVSAGTINKEEIHKAYDEYINYSKIARSIKHDKASIKVESLKVRAKIRTININDYIKSNIINNDISKVFVDLLKTRCIRVKNTCDIYIQFMSAKLDALKDSYITDKKILFETAQEIVRRGGTV